jgi:nicotinamidase-related amidase
MPVKSPDLHGNAPDHSDAVLLLVDVINDLEFPDGERLLAPALAAARRLAALRERARAVGIPVVYANDNFGRWRSDFRDVVDHVRRDGVRGRPIAELLAPDPDDYFVLKPKHSAFYETTLEMLLEHLGSRVLIIGGFAGDVCVQLTAGDAYLRDFGLVVPEDCIATAEPERTLAALSYMRRVMHADTTRSERLDLRRLRSGAGDDREAGGDDSGGVGGARGAGAGDDPRE